MCEHGRRRSHQHERPNLAQPPSHSDSSDLDKGSLLVLKFLPPASQEQKDAAQREVHAVSLLQHAGGQCTCAYADT